MVFFFWFLVAPCCFAAFFSSEARYEFDIPRRFQDISKTNICDLISIDCPVLDQLIVILRYIKYGPEMLPSLKLTFLHLKPWMVFSRIRSFSFVSAVLAYFRTNLAISFNYCSHQPHSRDLYTHYIIIYAI